MLKILKSLSVATVLITACVASKTTPMQVTSEEHVVYETVIKSLYVTEGIKLVVIKDHTATDASPSKSLEAQVKYIRESLGAAIEAETLNDYKLNNRRAWELDRHLSLDVQYALLGEAEFSGIFKKGRGWRKFYRTYPNSQGLMTLSRVGFDAEMKQALVYVGNQSDYSAGEGYYVFLAKEGDVWSIQSLLVAWTT